MSSPGTLFRREAVELVGGYDCTLRARQGQGCEDQALYMALAERWNFTVVPHYLIAYRNPTWAGRDWSTHGDAPEALAFNRACQEFEITQSKADLEERIGRPVASFAYPYGSAAHINQTSVELVQQAGFLRACTSRKALVREEESCFAWPRMHVPNLDGNEFEKVLTSAFS